MSPIASQTHNGMGSRSPDCFIAKPPQPRPCRSNLVESPLTTVTERRGEGRAVRQSFRPLLNARTAGGSITNVRSVGTRCLRAALLPHLIDHRRKGATTMRRLKLIGAAALLSAAVATPVLAQEVGYGPPRGYVVAPAAPPTY